MNNTTSRSQAQAPIIYSVTWTNNSPTDYSGLTGNQGGGLDPATPWDYQRNVIATGKNAITTTVMADGENIFINNVNIIFSSVDTLSTIITKINTASVYTNVIADQRRAATYLSLSNNWGWEGTPFNLVEGSGTALTKLGFTAGSYSRYPYNVGSSTYSNVSTGTYVTINGVDVYFTAGDITSAATQINAYTANTGVFARPAGPYLQLASAVPGQPYAINQGNALPQLGFTIGNYGGFPNTVTQSNNFTLGSMRWTQVVNELESVAPINFVGNFVKGGTLTDGSTVTTLQFNVGVATTDQITTIARSNEPDAGTVLYNEAAIKRAVARALSQTMVSNQLTYDPTIKVIGAVASRYDAPGITTMTAQALDTNVVVIANNVTVTRLL